MLHIGGPAPAGFRRELFSDSPGCERCRPGFVRVSSHSIESGPDGIGRQEESSTIHLPGGWQWRGSAIGPLLAAIIILSFGQHAISWFALAALLAAIIMVRLGVWYKARLTYVVNHPQKQPLLNTHISKRVKYWALFILIMLVFSKYFYTACITSYFTFFLMDKFGVSVQTSQLCLFVFLAAFAIGTVAGGMLGDKFGRKY